MKQTEVDCEYLKRCCETLTEENRRLQKELQELRALKTSQPFYMQLPATTLTMCPSCERVATTSTTPAAATTTTNGSASAASAGNTDAKLTKTRGYPFCPLQKHVTQSQPHTKAHQDASWNHWMWPVKMWQPFFQSFVNIYGLEEFFFCYFLEYFISSATDFLMLGMGGQSWDLLSFW